MSKEKGIINKIKYGQEVTENELIGLNPRLLVNHTTIVHAAALYNRPEILRVIGGDVNVLDSYNDTPLSNLITQIISNGWNPEQSRETIETLLELCADVPEIVGTSTQMHEGTERQRLSAIEKIIQEKKDSIEEANTQSNAELEALLASITNAEDSHGVLPNPESAYESQNSNEQNAEEAPTAEKLNDSNNSIVPQNKQSNSNTNASINSTSYSLDSTVARDEIMQTIRNSQIEIKEIDLFLPEDSYDIDKIIEASAANKEYLAAMAELQKAGEDKLAVVQVGDHSRLVLGENEDGTTPSSILPYMLPEDMEPITGPFSIWSDPLSTISGAGVLILSGIFAHEINHHGC